MAAVYKNECGKDSCLCTFLLFDLDLANEWLKSFKEFLGAAITSLKSIKAKTLFMPWTLSTLEEHEVCFQQWCILQLLIGVAATLVIFLLYVIWFSTLDYVQLSVGSLIVNALLNFACAFLATWIMWFGVTVKHGCCCAITCCCLGKPNILMVCIVEGIFALLTLMNIINALGYGHVLLIIAALVAMVHLVTQVYMTVEVFVVWMKSQSSSSSGGDAAAIGDRPVILGQTRTITVKSKSISAADRDDKIGDAPAMKTDTEAAAKEVEDCSV